MSDSVAENQGVEGVKAIPTVSDDRNNSYGDIKINHSVVASIVRLATLEVDGTYAVGGSFVDGIAEMFSKKESERGVRVAEDEAGDYIIEVRVVLRFGVELAHVAVKIQQNVKAQVQRMTMKNVSRVNVIIDGVRMKNESDTSRTQPDEWHSPHTD